MTAETIVIAILIPVLFWAGFHHYQDRHRPEPLSNMAICLVLGFASAFVAKLMYAGLGFVGLRYDAVELAARNPAALLAYSVFAIGLIEELAKFLPFFFVALRFEAFDEPLDGIIYASLIALGFAAAENLHYLGFLSYTEAIARGFAGPIVHIMFASIWGYVTGRAFLERKGLASASIVSLAAAVLLHGLYDFGVLALPKWMLPLSASLILVIWLWRIWLILRLHREARAEGND